MAVVTLPATGTGTNQPGVYTDLVAGANAQYVKLLAGATGEAFPVAGTPNGELVAAERTALFSDLLLVALDGSFWTTTLANGGTTSIASGQFQLLTNTTANGSAAIVTLSAHRLLAGTYNVWDCWLNSDAGAANNTRQWGPYSSTDGLFFQMAGTTFNLGSRRSSTDTVVAAASWNVNNTFANDANWHRYTIVYGALDAYWLIDGALVHRILGGAAANPLTDKLDLPSQMANTNAGGSTTSLRTSARGLSVWRVGQPLQRPRVRHFSAATTNTTLKTGAGTVRRLILGNAATAGTVTLADAVGSTASGVLTVVGVTTSTSAGPARVLELDLDFSTGLSITSTVTNDVTVLFD